jgi:excisionase family DNA binding protein
LALLTPEHIVAIPQHLRRIVPVEGYLTVKEVGARVQVHEETVKRLCRDGQIPAEKFRNAWIIREQVADQVAGTYDRRPGRKRRLI